MCKYIPVVLLTRISDEARLCLLREHSPMTGFHRRSAFLDPHSSVTCGVLHPIPLLIPKAGLRTPGHKNVDIFFHYMGQREECQNVFSSISYILYIIRKRIYHYRSVGCQNQYVQKQRRSCIMTTSEQRLSAVRMRMGLTENRESGENPERNRHCMRGGSAQDESRSLGFAL